MVLNDWGGGGDMNLAFSFKLSDFQVTLHMPLYFYYRFPAGVMEYDPMNEGEIFFEVIIKIPEQFNGIQKSKFLLTFNPSHQILQLS